MVSTTAQRILAPVVALGSLLAVSLVVLVPSAAQAAPKCQPGYPSRITTHTVVRLVRNVGQYGDRNTATVRVTSGSGTPGGRVTLRVAGRASSLALHGGVARSSLPRNLAAGHTYRVSATYPGFGCYKGSSGSTYYTVRRAGAHIRGLHARDIRRGGHPFVSGRVVTSSGATAGGRVVVRLYHGGLRRTATASVHHGRFAVRFGRVYGTGRWVARATKPPTANFAGSSASDTFRVRR
jgi:hypothetical protein